jgi:chemotaxis methyl-accepting protein methylase
MGQRIDVDQLLGAQEIADRLGRRCRSLATAQRAVSFTTGRGNRCERRDDSDQGQLNLARPFHGVPAMDVIFLRNVLIYFDTPTKRQVLSRVAEVLRPRGYLFLGGSETTYGLSQSFERIHHGKTVYYHRAQAKE